MGTLKIWWVLAADDYYPGIDNFEKSFYTKEEAEIWINDLDNRGSNYDNYIVINILERL